MPIDQILALAILMAAATWSPGPNNAMLAASGATHGFRQTVPHVLGVALGFALMVFLVALGLGAVFDRFPVLYDALRIAGMILLGWVAWRIATTRPPGDANAPYRPPFTFLQASGFQWINPKAWAMCVSIGAQFVTGSDAWREAAVVAAVSVAVGLSSASAWAGLGAALRRVLAPPARFRAFNITMAALVFLGVLYLARDLLT